MNLLIAVSGCSGGSNGPQGIYQHLQKSYESESLKILPFETLPDVIDENVKKISEIALSSLDSFENLYLVGHSMGGAIAALAAYEINQKVSGSVKGLVLIDTQTDGLHTLKKLDIPVLFYHGQKDQYFPTWQIEPLFKTYLGPKRMVELESLDHDLKDVNNPRTLGFSQDLAKDLFSEISDFFFKQGVKDLNPENTMITRAVSLTPKKGILEYVLDFLRREV